MSKLWGMGLAGLAAAAAASGTSATVIGPDPQACTPHAAHAAALVRVTGFKTRAGTVRVRAFNADTPYLFDKRGTIERVEAPVPAADPVEICVPLPRPGAYAFDVRHDADADGATGMKDGGGMSGNPSYSLWQVITKHKPPVEKVAVPVRDGVVVVPVVLNYFQGGSFGPVGRTAAR